MSRLSQGVLARKAQLCFSIWSTNEVLPWSTLAMMATLRNFMIVAFKHSNGCDGATLKRRANIPAKRDSLAQPIVGGVPEL
jgi:hypothetical protein